MAENTREPRNHQLEQLVQKYEHRLEVVRAYCEGKSVECRYKEGPWARIRTPVFAWELNEYRVKPEPRTGYAVVRRDREACTSVALHPNRANAERVRAVFGNDKYEVVQFQEVLED